MMLGERPGYRIDSRTIKRALDRISWSYRRREHKPLHACNHLYWFLFVSYRGVVLVLVMLVKTRPMSPKTVFICVFYCGSGIEDFVGSSVRKVSLFHFFLQNLHFLFSTFPRVEFVVLFPTKLVLFPSDFNCKSFGISGFQRRVFNFPHLVL